VSSPTQLAAAPPAVSSQPIATALTTPVSLQTGYPWIWTLFAVLASVALSLALRRLPQRSLDAGATSCSLENGP
jgi:hypothetical protein